MAYDDEQDAITNERGSKLLADMREMKQLQLDHGRKIECLMSERENQGRNIECLMSKRENQGRKIESLMFDRENQGRKLESLMFERGSLLQVRSRALSTWVRDALGKDTERRVQKIRELNKNVVNAGNIRVDASVVLERFRSTASERKEFPTLYGLTAEAVKDLGIGYNPFEWTLFISLTSSRREQVREVSGSLG
ncbi:hypothetical protein N7510_000700 [Penicillium lagena]|uniref:uncharacterized protein n=1 Tax=Penicillium lagena TaxID=94218 RepID=UPI002540D156|nr:uncharacterized protein N7510_000700 [Penicillium lagena]KAJ5624391.1 hypothetical protein N7510_000700 [Penicillium lagena]